MAVAWSATAFDVEVATLVVCTGLAECDVIGEDRVMLAAVAYSVSGFGGSRSGGHVSQVGPRYALAGRALRLCYAYALKARQTPRIGAPRRLESTHWKFVSITPRPTDFPEKYLPVETEYGYAI